MKFLQDPPETTYRKESEMAGWQYVSLPVHLDQGYDISQQLIRLVIDQLNHHYFNSQWKKTP